jgi:hypothetical protein
MKIDNLKNRSRGGPGERFSEEVKNKEHPARPKTALP